LYYFKIYFFLIVFATQGFGNSFDNLILETTNKNGIQYFCLHDFIYKNNLKSTYYESKEKLEIIYEGNKLYFSPHSSFCKINDQIFHLTYPNLLINNKIYIAVLPFQRILEASNLSIEILKINNNNIEIKTQIYDINDFYIEKKANGLKISIHTTKEFSEKNIATSINSSGWLNVTILNSKIDSIGCKNSKITYPIAKVNTIQSSNSAQISFLLRKKVDDIITVSSANGIDILLTINQAEYASKIKEIRKKWLIDTIIIDAGHGGKDPGAIGVNHLQEKTVTLDIARMLGKMIERTSNLNVVYTRQEDVFIPLWKRTQIANDMDGDLFISLHANAASHNHIKGFETYLLRVGKNKEAIEVAKRENSVIELETKDHQYMNLNDEKLIIATMAQNSDQKASEFLADLVQTNLDQQITSRNRGIKQAGFHVLVGAAMPNVLIEVGFLSNKEEAKALGTSQYRRKIAKAIYEAILDFKDHYEK